MAPLFSFSAINAKLLLPIRLYLYILSNTQIVSLSKILVKKDKAIDEASKRIMKKIA